MFALYSFSPSFSPVCSFRLFPSAPFFSLSAFNDPVRSRFTRALLIFASGILMMGFGQPRCVIYLTRLMSARVRADANFHFLETRGERSASFICGINNE